MQSLVRENNLEELNSSRPVMPMASPTTMNSPMEVGLAFLLISEDQKDLEGLGGAEASPRVRNSCTAGSVEFCNNSRGFPCARMVRVLGSRKTELSATVKILASS